MPRIPDSPPEISVVVPSHDRPLRLRWLLNALEAQDLEYSRWEVVIVHDSSGPETEELLESHPLAAAGVLRHKTLVPGEAHAAAKRNIGWRMARAPFIAFTDDDCKPPPDWLRKALAAAERHPDAIVQGATRGDPDEEELSTAPYYHSQSIRPPRPWAQTCNIVYPRELLERVGGFDDTMLTAEDTDLAFRVRETGVDLVGAPEVVNYHGVIELSFRQMLRSLWRWQDMPSLLRKHPQLRDEYPLGYFWKRTHVWLPVAVAALIFGRGRRWSVLLAAPWAMQSMPQHGGSPRGRWREVMELPAHAVMDATEMAAMAKGSIKHRTLFL